MYKIYYVIKDLTTLTFWEGSGNFFTPRVANAKMFDSEIAAETEISESCELNNTVLEIVKIYKTN